MTKSNLNVLILIGGQKFMNNLTDIIAIKKLQKRNEKSLKYLMDKYTPYVATIVNNIIRSSMNTQDVEEVVADVFISLWNNAQNIELKNLKGYLGTMARNKAINKLRESLMTIDIEDNDIPDDSFIKHIEQKELSYILNEALEKLSKEDREIFIRYYWYFQTVKEISQDMNVSLTSVTSKLSRGRKKLKTILTEKRFLYENN